MDKYIAIAALLNSAAAINLRSGPDVYGPNGADYTNTDATYDLSRIGIDILKKGTGPQCKAGDWTTIHWRGELKDGRVVTDSR